MTDMLERISKNEKLKNEDLWCYLPTRLFEADDMSVPVDQSGIQLSPIHMTDARYPGWENSRHWADWNQVKEVTLDNETVHDTSTSVASTGSRTDKTRRRLCRNLLWVFLVGSFVAAIVAAVGLSIIFTFYRNKSDNLIYHEDLDKFLNTAEEKYLSIKFCDLVRVLMRGVEFPVDDGILDCSAILKLTPGSEDLQINIHVVPEKGFTLKEKFRRALREQVLIEGLYRINGSDDFIKTKDLAIVNNKRNQQSISLSGGIHDNVQHTLHGNTNADPTASNASSDERQSIVSSTATTMSTTTPSTTKTPQTTSTTSAVTVASTDGIMSTLGMLNANATIEANLETTMSAEISSTDPNNFFDETTSYNLVSAISLIVTTNATNAEISTTSALDPASKSTTTEATTTTDAPTTTASTTTVSTTPRTTTMTTTASQPSTTTEAPNSAQTTTEEAAITTKIAATENLTSSSLEITTARPTVPLGGKRVLSTRPYFPQTKSVTLSTSKPIDTKIVRHQENPKIVATNLFDVGIMSNDVTTTASTVEEKKKSSEKSMIVESLMSGGMFRLPFKTTSNFKFLFGPRSEVKHVTRTAAVRTPIVVTKDAKNESLTVNKVTTAVRQPVNRRKTNDVISEHERNDVIGRVTGSPGLRPMPQRLIESPNDRVVQVQKHGENAFAISSNNVG